MLPSALVTLFALAALLTAEYRERPLGTAIAKPIASCGFVALAWFAGAGDTPYGQVVLVALLLSWLGDVLLIPRDADRAFLAGLVSFLLGHVAFAVAFWLRGIDPLWAGAGTAFTLLSSGLAFRYLSPHLDGSMRLAVQVYVGVISLMVILAFGSVGAAWDARVLAGALCFYVSDLAVARQRFVARSFWNKSWGLPLYYAAQLLLAWSVIP